MAADRTCRQWSVMNARAVPEHIAQVREVGATARRTEVQKAIFGNKNISLSVKHLIVFQKALMRFGLTHRS